MQADNIFCCHNFFTLKVQKYIFIFNYQSILQLLYFSTTAKPLSKIPCNEFEFTEKHLLRKGLSQMRSALSQARTALSQNHHNRQLNITATEKMLYISMWLFRAIGFGSRKCAV